MRGRRGLLFIIVVSLSTTSAYRVAHANPIVPEVWAGVWVERDTLHDCTTGAPLVTRPYTITLCAGADFGSSICTGTMSEGAFDMTCSDTYRLNATCYVSNDSHVVGTQTGDVVVRTGTSSTQYNGLSCGSTNKDTCYLITGTWTRVASAPSTCNTVPVRTRSWGSLKILYR